MSESSTPRLGSDDPAEFYRVMMRATTSEAVMTDMIERAGIHRLGGDARPVVAAGLGALANNILSVMFDVSAVRRGGKLNGGVNITAEDGLKALDIMRIPRPIGLSGGVGVKLKATPAPDDAAPDDVDHATSMEE